MIPDAEDPRVIVDRLHAEIAAISPEHAALVAAYRALPRPAPRPVRTPRPPAGTKPRARKMLAYSSLRLGGYDTGAAARKAGISRYSAPRYEADFLATLGGMP